MADYQRWQRARLERVLGYSRCAMLTGARQCGKTTLARTLIPDNAAYRTLDDPVTRAAAQTDPKLFVQQGPPGGTLIIDEIQKVPDLISTVKIAVDNDNRRGQFLMTGSANINALPTVRESLAGRVGRVRLRPLSQGEIIGTPPLFIDRAYRQEFKRGKVAHSRVDIVEIIFRGGFPEATMIAGQDRYGWHSDYVNALIERDLGDYGALRKIDHMRELLVALAAWSSKLMVLNEIGGALEIDRRTMKDYISALMAFHIIDPILAWPKSDYDRIDKRDKFFMADTGMMAALLEWSPDDFTDDDKRGKGFETFAHSELVAQMDCAEQHHGIYHYRDKDGREIDFLIERADGQMLAVEAKSGITVGAADFKPMKWFAEKFRAGKPFVGAVLYSGDEIASFGDNCWAVPFDCLWAE